MHTLIKCYFIGVIGNITMGPVFLLTLKRSAQHGYIHGLVSALSAACADGLLFFMGMLGVLSFLQDSEYIRLAMFGLGGLFLVYLGVQSWREHEIDNTRLRYKESIPAVIIKTFFLTIINPGTLIYYMGASLSMLNEAHGLLLDNAIWGAGIVAFGASTVLCLVALAAKKFGMVIAERNLATITRGTGIFLMGFGAYCLYRFIAIMLTIIAH